jgi:hypothetical protein
MEWKAYKKAAIQEMRAYLPGENMSGVSVSKEDVLEVGGMIARNSKNHSDMWYVAKDFFDENYQEA